MSDPVPFEDYLNSLGRLTAHIDPTASTVEADGVRYAVESLADLPELTSDALAHWVKHNPQWTPVLGLVVGLSQEKLKNSLRDGLGSTGWIGLARNRPVDLVTLLDSEFRLIDQLEAQLSRSYTFADVLIARGGTRATASGGQASGRRVEDLISAIAEDLGLPHVARSRFVGRNGRTAPADLIVPDAEDASIVVAAKGFDSTGSKLTDAVREIEEMADVRLPRQFVYAVIDGIGWKSRQADLRRIHSLWESRQIDGMYTVASLGSFRADLHEAADRLKLI